MKWYHFCESEDVVIEIFIDSKEEAYILEYNFCHEFEIVQRDHQWLWSLAFMNCMLYTTWESKTEVGYFDMCIDCVVETLFCSW